MGKLCKYLHKCANKILLLWTTYSYICNYASLSGPGRVVPDPDHPSERSGGHVVSHHACIAGREFGYHSTNVALIAPHVVRSVGTDPTVQTVWRLSMYMMVPGFTTNVTV